MTRALLATLLALLLAAHAAAAGLRVIVRSAKGEVVADAVASLTPLDAPLPALTPPAQPVEISQEGEEYHPFVTAITVGTKVDFPNKDTVQHHIYSLSKPKRFEKPLYGPGSRESVVFDQPGIVVLGCNIHDWMVAYICVLTTPFFGVTTADGATALTVAPGRYRLDVWHPRLSGAQNREITIAAGETTPQEITVTLKPDRRIRRAPDGKGPGY